MSNFHYNDQTICHSCATQADYYPLKDTTHYDCDQYCICRNTSERSDKDIMYYNYFVMGKPMNLQPVQGERPVSVYRENYFLARNK